MINIENEKDEKNTKKRNKSKLKTMKKNLFEEDDESESEEVSDISFSISKPSDVDSLCEQISNKSKEKRGYFAIATSIIPTLSLTLMEEFFQIAIGAGTKTTSASN